MAEQVIDLGYSIAVSGNYIYVTGSENSDTAGISKYL